MAPIGMGFALRHGCVGGRTAARVEMIVCGVDHSDGARDAARVAVRLGAGLDLWLALVHVAAPPASAAIAPAAHVYPRPDDLDAGVEAGEALLNRIAADLDITARVILHVVVGDACERLRATAKDKEAHLIVVGSRGRGPLASALLGSVSSALVRDAPCPVVVVPPGSTNERYLARRGTP